MGEAFEQFPNDKTCVRDDTPETISFYQRSEGAGLWITLRRIFSLRRFVSSHLRRIFIIIKYFD